MASVILCCFQLLLSALLVHLALDLAACSLALRPRSSIFRTLLCLSCSSVRYFADSLSAVAYEFSLACSGSLVLQLSCIGLEHSVAVLYLIFPALYCVVRSRASSFSRCPLLSPRLRASAGFFRCNPFRFAARLARCCVTFHQYLEVCEALAEA